MASPTENQAMLNQQKLLRAYTAFAIQAAGEAALGGRLVVLCGMGASGVAAALGATLAGAACLAIEPDPQMLKLAMREGGGDFMVNSLDEALRILKNEVRKKRPVCVGLPLPATDLLEQMVERGVQPDLLVDFLLPPMSAVPDECSVEASDSVASQVVAMRTLIERGAQLLDLGDNAGGWFAGGAQLATITLQEWAAQYGYEMWHQAAESDESLRSFDQAALAALPLEDWKRRRWLEQAPKYFRRQGPERWLWLTASERKQLS
jgi:urocanate hydratase